MINLKNYNINDDIDEIIVETFNDWRPWLSVRPINIDDNSLVVMFSKDIRKQYPEWTKFKVRVKYSQKTYSSWPDKWKPKWKPYLYSYNDTIKVINN